MKKEIISLLILLLAPIIVFADGASYSETNEYKAFIINDNGTDIIDDEEKVIGHYDKNQDIRVVGRYKFGKTQYLQIEYKSDETEYGFIKDSDCGVKDEFIEPTSYDSKKMSEKVYTIKDNVEVFSGPSRKFKMIGKIPIGQTLNLYEDTFGYSFGYIEYNDIKGWIQIGLGNESKGPDAIVLGDSYEKNETTKETWKKTFLMVDTEVYSQEANQPIITIKANEVIEESSYKFYDDYATRIRYNGKIYYKNDYSHHNAVESFYIKVYLPTKLYENPESDKVIATIPADTKLLITRMGSRKHTYYVYYTEYKGKKGWIFNHNYQENFDVDYYFSELDNETNEWIEPKYYFKESHIVYDLNTNKEIGKITPDIEFLLLCRDGTNYIVRYIDENGKKITGSILSDEYIGYYSTKEEAQESFERTTTTNDLIFNDNEFTRRDLNKDNEKFTISDFVTIAITCGVVICTASVVLITYINKKKKNKVLDETGIEEEIIKQQKKDKN